MPNAESDSPTLLYLLKQVELAARARLEELLRPAGMTALQYTALTVLERQPDLTSAQLARLSFVTSQSMADMIVTLTRQGLIQRRQDPSDRRRLVLSLTTSGKRILRRFRGKVAALENEMVSELTQRQQGELRRSLLSCRSTLASTLSH